MTPIERKVWENRLRRMAERRGFKIMKSRRRDQGARDYGVWYIIQVDKNIHCGDFYSLEQVEHWLSSYDASPKAAA